MEALEGLARTVAAALFIVLWPWLFRHAADLANEAGSGLLSSGSVLDDTARLLAVAFVAGSRSTSLRSLTPRPGDRTIIDGIIGMARALGLVITGEGVETEQQLERLRDLGCNNVQGYLFARPGSAAVIEPLLDLQLCAPDGPAATITAV